MSDNSETPGRRSDADEYERKYMSDGGIVQYRDKQRTSPWFHLVFGLPLLLVWFLTLTGAGSKPAPMWLPFVFTPILAFAWVNFMSLRTTVSTRFVHVQFGVFGPKIPTEAVVSCNVVEYNPVRFGGWGIRRSLDGAWAYCMGGDGGKVVEVVWKDRRGMLKTVMVGSDNTSALALAIQEARMGGEHLRIARNKEAPMPDTEIQSEDSHQETSGRKRQAE